MSLPAANVNRRQHLWRWAVALVATVALIVSGSGLVVFAQSGAGESRGPQFVPADAAMYLEARLDLPAGQDEALAQMLTAFPGFADPSSFDMKVEELLAGLTSDMGVDVPVDELFGDVLTGEIGLAILDFEEAAMTGADPTIVVGMAIADPEMAASLLASLTADAAADGTASEELYGDTAIISDATTSAAVADQWLVLSNDVEQVKAAIDVLDGTAPSLAEEPGFAEAFARIPDGHLGAAYVDFASFAPLLDMAGTMAAGQAGMELPMGDLSAMLPRDMVAWLVAQPDGMDMRVVVTPGEEWMTTPYGESELATLFPADTQLYIETREVGATVEAALTDLAELLAAQAEQMPADEPGGQMGGLGDVEILFSEDSPFASILGAPLPQVLDFVSDVGIGAALDSDGLWLGIAGEVTDEAVAQERVDNVISLIRLMGGDPQETGIVVASEDVAGVEVTTITLPLEQATAGAGELPVTIDDTISVAVADGTLLMGTGDFVQAALTGDGSDSLATSAGYIDALGEDTVNSGLMYMNADELLTALDSTISAMVPEWAELAPYIRAVDRIVAVGTSEEGGVGARLSLIVHS